MKVVKMMDKDGDPKYAFRAFRQFLANWCINAAGVSRYRRSPKQLLDHPSIMMNARLPMDTWFPGGDDAPSSPRRARRCESDTDTR